MAREMVMAPPLFWVSHTGLEPQLDLHPLYRFEVPETKAESATEVNSVDEWVVGLNTFLAAGLADHAARLVINQNNTHWYLA